MNGQTGERVAAAHRGRGTPAHGARSTSGVYRGDAAEYPGRAPSPSTRSSEGYGSAPYGAAAALSCVAPHWVADELFPEPPPWWRRRGRRRRAMTLWQELPLLL